MLTSEREWRRTLTKNKILNKPIYLVSHKEARTSVVSLNDAENTADGKKSLNSINSCSPTNKDYNSNQVALKITQTESYNNTHTTQANLKVLTWN